MSEFPPAGNMRRLDSQEALSGRRAFKGIVDGVLSDYEPRFTGIRHSVELLYPPKNLTIDVSRKHRMANIDRLMAGTFMADVLAEMRQENPWMKKPTVLNLGKITVANELGDTSAYYYDAKLDRVIRSDQAASHADELKWLQELDEAEAAMAELRHDNEADVVRDELGRGLERGAELDANRALTRYLEANHYDVLESEFAQLQQIINDSQPKPN